MRLRVSDKGSKVYPLNTQSITMNNDFSHQSLNENKAQQAKHVQERKQIDRILQGIVKERMFGNFLSEDTRTSVEHFNTIEHIYKESLQNKPRFRSSFSRTIDRSTDFSKRRPSLSRQEHHVPHVPPSTYQTIDLNRTGKIHLNQYATKKERTVQKRLPKLMKKEQTEKADLGKKASQMFHHKKIVLVEKAFAEKFRKWVGGGSNVLLYELKVTRETISNRYKTLVDPKFIDRFFHFFGFPQAFGLRQFCGLIENAANCNLKFIYFWVFGLLDENSNGILTPQDFFQFLQRFSTSNFYVEEEVYQIQKYFTKIEKNFKPRDDKDQPMVEQMLVMNHNLKLQQLKDLLKQSAKERIDVNCVKNTCYHQTVMSLQHDPLERIKINQIESNQLATKKIKNEMTQNKKKLQNTPGLRLRDFYAIFGTKRPKIFCYFLFLLTGEKAQDFQ